MLVQKPLHSREARGDDRLEGRVKQLVDDVLTLKLCGEILVAAMADLGAGRAQHRRYLGEKVQLADLLLVRLRRDVDEAAQRLDLSLLGSLRKAAVVAILHFLPVHHLEGVL